MDTVMVMAQCLNKELFPFKVSLFILISADLRNKSAEFSGE